MSNVLLTGASRGIGFVVARDLAAAGHQVWLCARGPEVIQAARMIGSGVRASQLDVADAQAVQSTFAEVQQAWGGIDALVHAAAELGETGPFWELDEARLAATLTANTLGSFYVAKAFVGAWLERSKTEDLGQRRGKVVLFAGGGAGYGYPRFLPYGTSKAAVVRMCETMALELDAAHIAIDINVIAPGANETGMLAQVRAAGGEVRTVVPFSKPIALNRWLLSSGSDGISGRFLHVNDAYTAICAASLGTEAFRLRRSQ